MRAGIAPPNPLPVLALSRDCSDGYAKGRHAVDDCVDGDLDRGADSAGIRRDGAAAVADRRAPIALGAKRPLKQFRITLSLVRRYEGDESTDTTLRGIHHETATEAEAYEVFDEVMEMIRAAGRRRRERAKVIRHEKDQQKLFGT